MSVVLLQLGGLPRSSSWQSSWKPSWPRCSFAAVVMLGSSDGDMRPISNMASTPRMDGRAAGCLCVHISPTSCSRSICRMASSSIAARIKHGSKTAMTLALRGLSCTCAFTHATRCDASSELGSPLESSTGSFPVNSSSTRMPYAYTSTFDVTTLLYPTSAIYAPLHQLRVSLILLGSAGSPPATLSMLPSSQVGL